MGIWTLFLHAYANALVSIKFGSCILSCFTIPFWSKDSDSYRCVIRSHITSCVIHIQDFCQGESIPPFHPPSLHPHLLFFLVFCTHADVVAGVGCLSALYACVCSLLCVCQHSKTKTTPHIITKLSRWIVHDKSWSPVLVKFKRSMSRSQVLQSSSRSFPGDLRSEPLWSGYCSRTILRAIRCIPVRRGDESVVLQFPVS